MDRRFDAWAEADESLWIPVVEAALVRLVNNANDTAEFISSVPALQDFDQPRAVPKADGSIPMEVRLSSVVVLAELMRESAGKDVLALRAQIAGTTNEKRLANTEAYNGKRYE